MSIMNRRNAVIGWATWAVFKQVLKRNAKAEAAQVDVETRSRRLRRKEQAVEVQAEPKKRKRRKRRVVGFLVAGAIGVGAWLATRGKGKSDLE